jgi:hypothetical protein
LTLYLKTHYYPGIVSLMFKYMTRIGDVIEFYSFLPKIRYFYAAIIVVKIKINNYFNKNGFISYICACISSD